TTALSAQYFGSGRKSMCPVVLTQGVLITVIAYPLLMLCKPLVHSAFRGMNISSDQLIPQIAYFDALIWIILPSLLRSCFSSFFAGIGRTRIVMLSSVVMLVINIPLNYMLVFGKFGCPELGIVGAAYGSIISACASVLMLGAVYFGSSIRKEYDIHRSFRADAEIMKKLLRFGYPAGLEILLNMLAFTAMIMIFQSVSPAVAAAVTIVINWDIVSFVPLIGIEIGVTSLVGRFMGQKNPDLAHKAAMSGIKFGMCYSAIVFVLFMFIPGYLVQIFRPEHASSVFQDAVPTAVNMLRMACLYVMLHSVIISIAGALRGAGDTLWAMILTVGLHWVLLPVLYVLLHVFGQPAETAWFSLIIIFFLFVGLIVRRYRKGAWRHIRLTD
ncbi:MAG: MATE family efflux transporter, partial [Candidatus Omnitrophica bacterium]|nr:MATE family efflux transporter [Candidatus Omnitrophota bacterium]